jgi:RNA polymerase sigma factor (sigma-70 family)
MAQSGAVIRRPDMVASNDGPPDHDLLARFLSAAKAESEDAFRMLVARHGSRVLKDCRRVLTRAEDAEDASQGTFLALARNVAAIRDRNDLSGWLNGVAFRVALRVRARAIRRRAAEKRSAAISPSRIEPAGQSQELECEELRPILHEEVGRLPEEWRVPVVLTYLEGKSNEEVAALLRWPIGTVKSRLARARDVLRGRLARRGVANHVYDHRPRSIRAIESGDRSMRTGP